MSGNIISWNAICRRDEDGLTAAQRGGRIGR